MRVIAGSLGGRSFDSPKSRRTHPMSDKVRGALFNSLGGLEGMAVLDAYAGSGALSFEAASRGARSVVAVDNDLPAYKTIINNINRLGLDNKITAVRATVKSWSNQNSQAKFDVVICDPPYDDIRRDHLQKIALHVKPGGIAAFSLPPGASPELSESYFAQISVKSYGDAQLVFYRRTG